MRLRARLLLLIGAALLPAVAVQLHHETEARLLREADDRSDVLRLARLVGADLESVIEGAQQFLAATASLYAATGADSTACGRVLGHLSEHTARYTSLAVVDAAGRITCAADPRSVGHSTAHRAWFQPLAEGETFSIGTFAIGSFTGKPSLHIAHALRAERDGRDGAVVAALDLAWLGQRLAEVPLPPGGAVMVTDREGTFLGRWPEPERFVGRRGPPSLMQALQAGDFGVNRATGIDGIHRNYVLQPFSTRHAGLYVGIGLDIAPTETALASANRRAMLLIAGGALAALLLGLFVARRFMERPVELLVAAMERWREGESGIRLGDDTRLGRPGGQSEFLRIAAAFDEAAEAVETREIALRESDARFHQIAEAVDDVLVVVEPERQRVVYVSPAYQRLVGRPAPTYAAVAEIIHPDDWPRLAPLLRLPASQALDTEYRIRRPDGSERRVRHRRFPVAGSATGRVVAVLSDVTEERAAAERQIMLAREVDHRAKNILAVVQSILRLSRADSPRAFATAVEGRVAALARAHQLLAQSRWVGVDLVTLLREECAPYTTGSRARSTAERCVLAGPPLQLGPEAVQSVAMVVHELATNSAKHGALSVPAGGIRISWEFAPRREAGPDWFLLQWVEVGGPPIRAVPEQQGFGSRVVAATVERQLAGEVRYEWAEAGLRCHIAIPAEKIQPPHPAGLEPVDWPAPQPAPSEAPMPQPEAVG